MTIEDTGGALKKEFFTNSPSNDKPLNLSSSHIYGSPAWHRVRRNIPSSQLDFDNLDEYLKLQSRRKSWKYDDKRLHDAIVAGCHIVKEEDLLNEFFNWHSQETVTTLANMDGESISFQAPRRGNYTFSKKKKKVMAYVENGLSKLKLWWPIGGRTKLYYTHMLLITLTYSRTCDVLEKQQCWQFSTDEIRKFRYKLGRALGVSIASITVKEGCQDGYPSPHVLIMLDRPVLVFRHVSKRGKLTYRLQNGQLLNRLRKYWPHGHIDAEGVASGAEPVKYVLKYMTKGLSKDLIDRYQKHGIDGIKEYEMTFVKTHAYQKLFRLRPVHISAQFKARLNTSGRLDSNSSQSQHGTWYYRKTSYMNYREYWAMKEEYYSSIIPPPPSLSV